MDKAVALYGTCCVLGWVLSDVIIEEDLNIGTST